jgi:hypothetical protein
MSAATSFLTGFLKTTGGNIRERKDEAKDYFDKRMEQAHQAALEYKGRNKSKLDSSLQVGKQLMATGVPQDVVMAIANQNPDDLSTFFDTVQELKVKGVPFTPQAYRDLAGLDAEFNAGGENLTGLLTKIYTPLVNNVKADPQGWDFDPKGTMWATMMGHNAMERAHERLSTTEVLPGVSAAEVLADDGNPNFNPLNGPTPVINAEMIGNETRAARERLEGTDVPSITERTHIITQFNDMVGIEKNRIAQANPDALTDPTTDEQARKVAAARVLQSYPEASGIPEISRWLTGAAPPETGGETVDAPEGPTAPATAPVAPQATPVAPTAAKPPSELPDGSTLAKEFPDGTVGYVTPTGEKKRYTKQYVADMIAGQRTMQAQPEPGWMNDLGSEYD